MILMISQMSRLWCWSRVNFVDGNWDGGRQHLVLCRDEYPKIYMDIFQYL